jgi:hypothetical protein
VGYLTAFNSKLGTILLFHILSNLGKFSVKLSANGEKTSTFLPSKHSVHGVSKKYGSMCCRGVVYALALSVIKLLF